MLLHCQLQHGSDVTDTDISTLEMCNNHFPCSNDQASPLVGSFQGQVAGAVQAEAVYLGRVPRQRGRRHKLQHPQPRAIRERPMLQAVCTSSSHHKWQPVLVCLPQEPVRFIDHLPEPPTASQSFTSAVATTHSNLCLKSIELLLCCSM